MIFHSFFVCLPEGTIYLGKFHHDRSLFSRSLEIMVYFRGIIPRRTIQVSEI